MKDDEEISDDHVEVNDEDEAAVEDTQVKADDGEGVADRDEDDAPTLVEARPSGDSKLMKELDDEAPKTFPQVVRASEWLILLFVGNLCYLKSHFSPFSALTSS